MEEIDPATLIAEPSVSSREKNSHQHKTSVQSTAEPVRVALCDLNPTIRCGLEHILNADPDIEIVLTAASQEEVINKADSLDIDVIEIDIDDGKKAGLDLLSELRERIPDAKIMIFTDCLDSEIIVGAIEMGVEAFQCKQDAEADEIISAIHTVHNGGKALAPCVTEALMDHMQSTQYKKQVPSQLSSREHEVLELIGTGKTNSDIADNLYISVRTVKFHVSSILNKLNVKNRTQAALWLL